MTPPCGLETGHGCRQWQGEVPPGLSKRKVLCVPQTVFELEPDRYHLLLHVLPCCHILHAGNICCEAAMHLTCGFWSCRCHVGHALAERLLYSNALANHGDALTREGVCRLDLQPGEIGQLLHSWHDAFASVRQILYTAAQQQPVDYQALFKVYRSCC